MHARLVALLFALAPHAQDPRPVPLPAPVPSPAADAKSAPDVAPDPFQTLAAGLQLAVEGGEQADFDACFDLDAVFARVGAGVDADPEFARGFFQGVRTTLLPSLFEMLRGALEGGGSLHLLRVRKQGDARAILFRLLLEGGGVEYFEFAAATRADGKTLVGDWTSYSTGEPISETIHRLYLPLALKQKRGLLERLLGRDQLLAKHWGEVEALLNSAREHKSTEGLALWAALPAELQRDKFLLLLRLRLTQPLPDPAEYRKTLEDFRRFHPGDPATELQSIDYHFMRQEWKQAVEAVQRLRQSVEGDPYLDTMESTLHLQSGELESARRAVEHAAEEPDPQPARWMLVTVCLKQKDHAGVLGALLELDGRFPVQWNDLSRSAEYKDFVASPQHAEWLRHLAAKTK